MGRDCSGCFNRKERRERKVLPLNPSQSGPPQGETGFSWPNARALAERCSMAYHETESSLRIKGIAGKFVWNNQTDTEALVTVDSGLETPDCICVAFRGSSSLRDWLQDFKVNKEHPRKGLTWSDSYEVEAEVHRGFYENVESISEDLVAQVSDLCKNKTQAGRPVPLFLTGHSKGGAEATLCALELQRQKFNIAGIYLFGCPRVGNRAFANIYNATLYEETYRVVNENDIVPRVPGVLMGYKHVGQMIFLPVGGGWCENPSLMTLLLSDALGLWGAYRHETDVLLADHFIAAYQKRIQNL